ncbi:MAG: hypothetical protein ACLFM0_09675 [Spirochaetales bacterium]
MSAKSRVKATVLACGVCITLLSCATGLPLAPERAEAALPADASVYLALRTGRLEALTADFVRAFDLETDEIDTILTDSDRVVAALGAPDNAGALSAVASGSYPGGRMRLGLTTSRRWRRRTVDTDVSSRPFFEERDGVGELAVPSGTMVLFSNGSMRNMVQRAARSEPAADAVDLDPEAELSLYIPRIGDRIRETLPSQARGLPLVSLSVNVRYDGDAEATLPYELFGAIELDDERAARVFSVISRLVIGALAEGVPVSELSVERNGSTIQYEGLPADEQRLREWAQGFLEVLGVDTAAGEA